MMVFLWFVCHVMIINAQNKRHAGVSQLQEVKILSHADDGGVEDILKALTVPQHRPVSSVKLTAVYQCSI